MDAALISQPRRFSIPLKDGRHQDGVVQDGPGVGQMSVLDFGDPKRPVDLVFVHANGFNAATYRSLLAPLSGSMRILAPDLRGHGRTTLSTRTRGRWTWHDHRDDLIGLLDSLTGPPVVMAGHSMGATSSLLAAAGRPDRVSRLVLFEPVIMPRGLAPFLALPLVRRAPGRSDIARGALRRRERFDSRDQALASWRGRGAFKGWSEMMLSDYVSEAFIEEAISDGDGASNLGVRLACSPRWEASNYAAQGHDPWRAMKRLPRPIRILKAQKGSTCLVPATPRGLPHVTVETVEGGHLFPMRAPEIVRDALFEAAV